MGWGFRRSLRFGPFRINLSKSGIGYSVGMRGLRVGKDGKGRNYRALGIPGTGIFRRDYYPSNPNRTPINLGAWFAPPRIFILIPIFLVLLWALIKSLT
jgi:Protein of unknown function (DUF4236)